MDKITLELTSDRPVEINLGSFKVQGGLMMAHMGGYLDKGSVKFDEATRTLTLTIKEKAIQMIEERLK